MSKIYFSKIEQKKLIALLHSIQYVIKPTPTKITLKKVYCNVHDLLLLKYPKILADLINDYITDVMTFRIYANVDQVYESFGGLWIYIRIITCDVVINFIKYDIDFILDYTIQRNTSGSYNLHANHTSPLQNNNICCFVDLLNSEMAQYTALMPFFNYYLQNMYNIDHANKIIDLTNEKQLYPFCNAEFSDIT